MKDFFKDIFEYHHHFNQKLADQLAENEGGLPENIVPLFSHCLNAHQIWNARITGKAQFGVNDVHPIESFKLIDDQNYKDTIEIIESHDLYENISYTNSRGDRYDSLIHEILFHVANHFTHHRGQVIAELKKAGVEPMITDYIFYKRW